MTEIPTKTTKPMTPTKAITDITKLRERREAALRKTAATFDDKEDSILNELQADERARVVAFFKPIGAE